MTLEYTNASGIIRKQIVCTNQGLHRIHIRVCVWRQVQQAGNRLNRHQYSLRMQYHLLLQHPEMRIFHHFAINRHPATFDVQLCLPA